MFSLLSNRLLCVVLSGMSLQESPVYAGAPQGIIDFTFFLI